MGKRALPLLTGGLNEKTRPDLIKDDQLQVCTNYEINGDGFLHRRKDVTEFDAALTAAIDEVFDYVSFVSEPYYPQSRIKVSGEEMDSDYILFVFGTKTTQPPPSVILSELHIFYYNLDDDGNKIWTNVVNDDNDTLQDLLTEASINYTFDSDIQITVTPNQVFIVDGINNTHTFLIDIDGLVRTGISGIPAPTNKAGITQITDWVAELWEDDASETRLSAPGLFQCTYTVITKNGEESNPAPLSETLDMQFFKLDADSMDKRWIEKIQITDLSVPDVPIDILETLEFFKVYIRVLRYADGMDVMDFDFSEQFKITNITANGIPLISGVTGNNYTLTEPTDVGNKVGYENDIAPVAKLSAEVSGVTMLGNVKTKISFPYDFRYFHKITISSSDIEGYVDAVIKLRLWDANASDNDIPEGEGRQIEDFNAQNYVTTSELIDENTKHIRLFDGDLTTPLSCAYNPAEHDNDRLDLYVKIPFLAPSSAHDIYLCWNHASDFDTYSGVPDYYQTYEYGKIFEVGGSNAFANQTVWNTSRVNHKSRIISDFDISIPGGGNYFYNKADTSTAYIEGGGHEDQYYQIDIVDGIDTIPIINQENISIHSLKMSSYTAWLDYEPPAIVGSNTNEKGFACCLVSWDADSLHDDNSKALLSLETQGSEEELTEDTIKLLIRRRVPGDSTTGYYYYVTDWITDEGYQSDNWVRFDEIDIPLGAQTFDHPHGVGTFLNFYLLSWDTSSSDNKCSLFVLNENGELQSQEVTTPDNVSLRDGYFARLKLGYRNYAAISSSVYDRVRLDVGKYYDANNESDKDSIKNMLNFMPEFDNMIGYKYSDASYNNKITFDVTREIELKERKNMIKWSNINSNSFPDLNFKQLREPIKKIMGAPSFLQFQYRNTFIIFTRNSINRFVLEGQASGWSGSASSLIEEKKQYGLLADKSLVMAGNALFWLSEVGAIMWNKDGMNIISKNIIDVPIDENAIAFYSPLNNQYILHYNDGVENEESNGVSYVYHIERNAWTKYTGLDISSVSTLTGGTRLDNVNLLLDSNGTLNKFPTEDYTSEESEIRTKDLFFEKGVLRKMKADFEAGDTDVEMISIMTKNDLSGNDIIKTNTIINPSTNHWRGIALANSRGKELSFKIKNANIIKSIMYDLKVEG